jgi:hypothetical protein
LYFPNDVVDLNDRAKAVRVLVRFVGEMPRRHGLDSV